MPGRLEYRRHQRKHASELPIGLFDGGRRVPDTAINDLSIGGAGVTMADRLDEGQELIYSVVLPGGEVKGRAVVRWVQPFAMGYRSGIEFQAMGFWDRLRLKRYIGESIRPRLPEGVARVLDKLLIAGTVSVVGLLALDALGLTIRDALDLAIFYIWL